MNRSGLSQVRLARLHQSSSGYVERGEIPGMVALVSQHDDVHVETLGSSTIRLSRGYQNWKIDEY